MRKESDVVEHNQLGSMGLLASPGSYSTYRLIHTLQGTAAKETYGGADRKCPQGHCLPSVLDCRWDQGEVGTCAIEVQLAQGEVFDEKGLSV